MRANFYVCRSYWGKLVGGLFWPPPSWIGLRIEKKKREKEKFWLKKMRNWDWAKIKKKKTNEKKMTEEELWEITKEENKTTISCNLKLAKENKLRYRKQMHTLWNETWMFKSEEQHLACQNRSFLKNNRVTEIEIQQLQREIKKRWNSPRNCWHGVGNELWRVESYRNC